LLKDAYEESKKLFEFKIPSWYGSIRLLIKNIRGLKELSNVSKHKFKSSYQILARISSFSLLRSQYNFCFGLRT
jgi:hypothetical protein